MRKSRFTDEQITMALPSLGTPGGPSRTRNGWDEQGPLGDVRVGVKCQVLRSLRVEDANGTERFVVNPWPDGTVGINVYDDGVTSPGVPSVWLSIGPVSRWSQSLKTCSLVILPAAAQ